MSIHKPVLLKESIEALNLKEGDTVVDATLGGGGHSLEILKQIGEKGRLIAIDQDQEAIERFKNFLEEAHEDRVILVKDNFANLGEILTGLHVASVRGIIADLGFSSDQLEQEGRGISFLKDDPLDMRMDKDRLLKAEHVVNEYSLKKLTDLLRKYGEEKYASSIARKIDARRKVEKIQNTRMLAEIVSQAVPQQYRHKRIHPATKTFQAIRVEVNNELGNLEKFLPQAMEFLDTGGRIAVISFHSLEDRIVKSILRENARGCICPKDFPQCRCDHRAKIRIITKKPLVPDQHEIMENPRSRSAKLRVAEKVYMY